MRRNSTLLTRAWGITSIVLLPWCLVAAPGAEPVAGSVKTVRGDVVVIRGGSPIACHEGLHLAPLDVLRTSGGASVGVILQDGTRIALGPDTELTIDRFVYEPVEGKFDLFVRLARGVMTYISGKIAQFSPASARVETPVGIVGLRGTHLAVSLEGG